MFIKTLASTSLHSPNLCDRNVSRAEVRLALDACIVQIFSTTRLTCIVKRQHMSSAGDIVILAPKYVELKMDHSLYSDERKKRKFRKSFLLIACSCLRYLLLAVQCACLSHDPLHPHPERHSLAKAMHPIQPRYAQTPSASVSKSSRQGPSCTPPPLLLLQNLGISKRRENSPSSQPQMLKTTRKLVTRSYPSGICHRCYCRCRVVVKILSSRACVSIPAGPSNKVEWSAGTLRIAADSSRLDLIDRMNPRAWDFGRLSTNCIR
jgi:hypothetical protein